MFGTWICKNSPTLPIVYDIFGRNTWQADFGTLPPETHQKPPKQPFESYRKSVSKFFKRKFYFLVVFHVKSADSAIGVTFRYYSDTIFEPAEGRRKNRKN